MASSSSSCFDIEPLICGDEPRRHSLDACSLCRRPLAGNCDIFMYRGDTPFCSEECRNEQMEIDAINMSKFKSTKKHSSRNGTQQSIAQSRSITFTADVAVAS